MFWFYERGLEECRIETSFDDDAKEYVLAIHRGVHDRQEERFTDELSFGSRLEVLEQELAAEQWKRVGPPVFLKNGWKL
jgi:hypothetical protein